MRGNIRIVFRMHSENGEPTGPELLVTSKRNAIQKVLREIVKVKDFPGIRLWQGSELCQDERNGFKASNSSGNSDLSA